jgi:hypothetical protein
LQYEGAIQNGILKIHQDREAVSLRKLKAAVFTTSQPIRLRRGTPRTNKISA